MRTARRTAVALTVLLALGAGGVRGEQQTAPPNYSRQSVAVPGRQYAIEVLTPANQNGLGAIWIVSSGGVSNREQTLTPSFERRVAPLLKHGYTVFAVIHRSSPQFQLPDYLDDGRHAVRFVRHNAKKYGIDGEQLGIAGSSAGGSIALTVALTGDNGDPITRESVEQEPSRVKAVAAFFAATDFLNWSETNQNIVDFMQQQAGKLDPAFQFQDVDPKSGERKLISSRALVLAVLRAISPITHVGPGDPPTLLIHGDADKNVPVGQSRRLLDKLNAEKVRARLVVREGQGHAYSGWEDDAELIAEWFDEQIRGNARAKPPGAGGF